jgi:hypothetical protein
VVAADGGAGGVPFGVYAIAQNFNIPLQIQPQMFMSLCLVSWAQILVYGKKSVSLIDCRVHPSRDMTGPD